MLFIEKRKAISLTLSFFPVLQHVFVALLLALASWETPALVGAPVLTIWEWYFSPLNGNRGFEHVRLP